MTTAEKLVNASTLSKRFGLEYGSVQNALKKIKPRFVTKMGRGEARYYDRTEAEGLMRELAVAKLPAALATATPPAAPAPALSLSKVTEAIDDLGDKVAALDALCKTLIEQNKVLNAQSNRTQTALNAICAELGIKLEH